MLICKLTNYGVGDGALKLDVSYLCDRKQAVSWNGKCSSPRAVNDGVPQGPLLFIIAINDLYYSVSDNTILFADDTTLYSYQSDHLAA